MLDKDRFITHRIIGDSLLFSSLLPGFKRNYLKAEESPGRFIRHPSFKNNGWHGISQSNISKDMMIGLAWAVWLAKDYPTAKRIIWNALKSFGRIGKYQPYFLESKIQQNLKKSQKRYPIFNYLPLKLQRFLVKHEPWTRVNLFFPYFFILMLCPWMPNFYPYTKHTGYKRHLQLLGILLEADIKSKLSSRQLKILKAYHAETPENALVTAILALYHDSKYLSNVMRVLENEQYFPKGRKPTNRDRRCDWLWERDRKDWEPKLDGELEEHTGGDYQFIASLIGLPLRDDYI